ncbi:MAG TPA: DUF502 domain-containing protein [Polyangiaceae bacterium]|nr:DUF502 domain-containing protein [Polyangiaceae bacterium]
MKTLFGYFWRGCLVLLPAAATIYIAFLIFTTIDHLVPVGVPGLGFALTVIFITLGGFLTSNVVGRAVLEVTERWLTRVPLAKLIYTSIRDLINAFVGDKKRFDRPVAVVLVPGSRIRALGFVTRDGLEALGMGDQVAVYFPQSYNFAGNLVIVPRDQVEPLAISTTDLMTFVVSGGVSGLGIEPEPVGRSSTGGPRGRTLLGIGPKKNANS